MAVSLRLFCTFWLLLHSFASASCSTDEDCSLNGLCLTRTCKCDPGWNGNDCGVLAIKATPLGAGFQQPNTSSWGGSVIKGPAKWHMYLSRMSESCGLTSWATNSEIIHAVSSTIEGPYSYSDTVLPRFAHNPTIHFVDGSYLLFHIGCGANANGSHPPVERCLNGSSVDPHPPSRHGGSACNGPHWEGIFHSGNQLNRKFALDKISHVCVVLLEILSYPIVFTPCTSLFAYIFIAIYSMYVYIFWTITHTLLSAVNLPKPIMHSHSILYRTLTRPVDFAFPLGSVDGEWRGDN